MSLHFSINCNSHRDPMDLEAGGSSNSEEDEDDDDNGETDRSY